MFSIMTIIIKEEMFPISTLQPNKFAFLILLQKWKLEEVQGPRVTRGGTGSQGN